MSLLIESKIVLEWANKEYENCLKSSFCPKIEREKWARTVRYAESKHSSLCIDWIKENCKEYIDIYEPDKEKYFYGY